MDIARRLKPNQLRLIMKIAETGKLQIASRQLAVSQPAASRTLVEVETLFGAPLFFRHPKGMEPTNLGRLCLRHAKVILGELDTLEAEAQQFSQGTTGHVKVGAVTGPAVGSLMPAVRRIKEKAPNIEVTIEVAPSTELMRGLVEGRFDFVICRIPTGYDSRDFQLYPARSEQVSLLVRPEHPLAAHEKLKLDALLDFEWVIQEIGSPIRQAIENAFSSQGLRTPQRIINSSSHLVMLSMLEATDAIVPQSEEVASLLCGDKIHSNLRRLSLSVDISVPPCFVILNRAAQIGKAAENLLHEVFAWL